MKLLKIKNSNRCRNWMQKVPITFLLLLITQVSFAFDESQGQEICTKIKLMLLKNKYCDNKKDCIIYQNALWSGHEHRRGGFSIYIYNIKSENFIKKINDIILNTYFNNNQRFKIKVRFYYTTHENTNHPIFGWGGDKPFISFELNKKEENEK